MKPSATRCAVRGPARLRSIAIGTILLSSCVTAPVGEKSSERTVAFTTYTVPTPEGDGWEVTRDPTKEVVSFRRQKTTLLGELVGSSDIMVVKVPFSEEAAAMSEEALADGFLEREHQGMLDLGVARNQYRLGEVKAAESCTRCATRRRRRVRGFRRSRAKQRCSSTSLRTTPRAGPSTHSSSWKGGQREA